MTGPLDPLPRLAPHENAALERKLVRKYVAEDIETACDPIVLAGVTWYDTLPMLSPDEHSGEVIDMAAEALTYALASGLVIRHHNVPQLVRFAQPATTTEIQN